jgi:hypothetical protein
MVLTMPKYGKNLSALTTELRAAGRVWSEEQVVSMTTQVLRAVDYMHGQGVCWADPKVRARYTDMRTPPRGGGWSWGRTTPSRATSTLSVWHQHNTFLNTPGTHNVHTHTHTLGHTHDHNTTTHTHTHTPPLYPPLAPQWVTSA